MNLPSIPSSAPIQPSHCQRRSRQQTAERAISPDSSNAKTGQPSTGEQSTDQQSTDQQTDEAIAAHVERWLDQFVIELDLCPFARKERVAGRVRSVVMRGANKDQLLRLLCDELSFLETHSNIETTLLIHPEALTDFDTYNQFLNAADAALDALGLSGTYQVASFHPQYQFADTAPDDVENFTNRSPYPMLHLLREASVERAVEGHPDVERIPVANIERLNALGSEYVLKLLHTIAQELKG